LMIKKWIAGFLAAVLATCVFSPAALAGDALPDAGERAAVREASMRPQAMSPITAAQKATDIAKLFRQFEVKAEKYYDDIGFSASHYRYTEAEIKMLAIVIHMEARGEPYNCKLAVGNVVMNRVLSVGYPGETIKAVVTRPNQFCYNSGVKPSAECMKAAREVLEHEAWAVPQNTYFFKSSSSRSNWGSHEFVTRLGHTAFYQGKYTGRYCGDAVPPRLFERTYQWPQYGCKPAARVRKIQIMLKKLGYQVQTDGYFGTDTKTAVLAFQKKEHLKADGIAGPSTLRVLIRRYGINKYLKL
jgi:spore germination cell wall hydrolase CwlJ-like protein